MSKAVEKAYEAYPLLRVYNEFYQEEVDVNKIPRESYLEGYLQAEKDLALTWEDISTIRQIMYDYNRQVRNEMSVPQNEEYCKEILKRFNEERSKR